MSIEWDADKARANAAKHHVAFDEAVTVFLDPLELTIPDPNHSIGEDRYVSVGTSALAGYWWLATPSAVVRSGSSLQGAPRCANAMTTKKPEPQAEYDFRGGVRGKHHRVLPKPASDRGVPGESRGAPLRKPGDRAPKPVKR